jgi:ATP-dependent RNA helicase DeaD
MKKFAKTDIRKEKLPKIEDVINQKKARIKTQIANIIKTEDTDGYIKFAQEMLKETEAEKVLAALLKHTFQDELDASNYNEIRDVSIDKKGTARLFVALGKIDDMTPKKLAAFIKQEAKVPNEKIKDIQIFDKFSFITVSFEEAEIILNIFKKKKGSRRPMVERAKR